MENYEKKLINKYIDNSFDNKEAINNMIDRDAKDENQKMIGKLALEDKKLTKDVANFALEESINPSDEKTKTNKLIDIAFDNKEAMNKIIDKDAKNENEKMLGKLALEDKKLTKDVANFALEENTNPSDDKTKIEKGIDIAFDNKEAMKKIIDRDVKDENQKMIGKLALEDKKLTKDVANFALEEGESISKKLDDFSEKKDLKESDYFKFASQNRKEIYKGLNVIFDNHETLNKMTSNLEPDSNARIFLKNEKFTREMTDLALNDGENLAENAQKLSESNENLVDYAKFITNSGKELDDIAKVIDNNKSAVNSLIDIAIEDTETREALKSINDNCNIEGLVTGVRICAGVVDFFNECSIF